MSFLLDELRSNDSDGLFDNCSMVDSYKTGIAVLDYMLGYKVGVYNESGELVDEYPALGINAGCMLTIVGKSSTAKTSTVLGLAGSIVRPFDNGLIIHHDLEQAMNMTRSKNMLHFNIKDLKEKYVLRQGQSTIDDIKQEIMQLYKIKTTNYDKYAYDSGKLDEFGNPIKLLVPTVVIIDSIPQLTVKMNENSKSEWAKMSDLTSQTDTMRNTGEISRFYTDILPFIRKANIIVMSINHITDKIQMGFVPEPSELLGLKQNEHLPCGKRVAYLAHYLLKSIAVGSEKYNKDDDGFDGFGLRLEIIKSRSNQSLQSMMIMYDKIHGVDPLRTCIRFADDNGLTGGNKRSKWFLNEPDKKFPMRTVTQAFKEDPSLYKAMYDAIIPVLSESLSYVDDSDLEVQDELYDY